MNREEPELIDAVDALLPQTQCQLCQYAGCRPYAEAIVKQGVPIDRCLPGGVKVLMELSALLKQNPEPYLPEMAKKAKPAVIAVIRENECIGCTKCIQACPVDAIIGASKQMHTVITDVCNGCELCIEPCPVDCIDLIPATVDTTSRQFAEQSRQRYQQRQARVAHQNQQQQASHQISTVAARQIAIAEAVARQKAKRKLI